MPQRPPARPELPTWDAIAEEAWPGGPRAARPHPPVTSQPEGGRQQADRSSFASWNPTATSEPSPVPQPGAGSGFTRGGQPPAHPAATRRASGSCAAAPARGAVPSPSSTGPGAGGDAAWRRRGTTGRRRGATRRKRDAAGCWRSATRRKARDHRAHCHRALGRAATAPRRKAPARQPPGVQVPDSRAADPRAAGRWVARRWTLRRRAPRPNPVYLPGRSRIHSPPSGPRPRTRLAATAPPPLFQEPLGSPGPRPGPTGSPRGGASFPTTPPETSGIPGEGASFPASPARPPGFPRDGASFLSSGETPSLFRKAPSSPSTPAEPAGFARGTGSFPGRPPAETPGSPRAAR